MKYFVAALINYSHSLIFNVNVSITGYYVAFIIDIQGVRQRQINR